MTATRDPDRLIRAFLLEGDDTLHDQVYDAVRGEIEQSRQRAFVGSWRTPAMSKFVTYGLGAAAVVIALVVGIQLFASPTGGTGGPGSEPTATPEPSASPDTTLPEGSFRVRDAGAPSGAPPITVTIPGPGWMALPDFGGLNRLPDTDPPTAMLLWSFPASTTVEVYGDPCHWASAERSSATTVDELAAALAAQPSRDASEPVDVVVGEHAGKHLILHVPEDIDSSFSDCDQRTFASYGVNGGEPYRTHQAPGQIDELWILDVDGQIGIITAMYLPDTSPAVLEEMRTIAESATFGE